MSKGTFAVLGTSRLGNIVKSLKEDKEDKLKSENSMYFRLLRLHNKKGCRKSSLEKWRFRLIFKVGI